MNDLINSGEAKNFEFKNEEEMKMQNQQFSANKKEEYFKTIFDNLPGGVSVINVKGEILYQNKSSQQILGIQDNSSVKDNFFSYIQSSDKNKIIGLFSNSTPNFKENHLFLFKKSNTNGQIIDIEGSANFFLNSQKDKLLLLNYRDMTLQNENEKEQKLRINYLQTFLGIRLLFNDDEPENLLTKFVELLSKTSNFNRVFVYKNRAVETELLSAIFESVATGNSIKSKNANSSPQNSVYELLFKSFGDSLSAGKIINLTGGEFSDSVKSFFEAQNIKSILLLPIQLKSKFWGFIGFENYEKRKCLSSAEINYLRDCVSILKSELLRSEKIKSILQNQKINKIVTIRDFPNQEVQTNGFNKYLLICGACKCINDGKKEAGKWFKPHEYLSEILANVKISHKICPDCLKKLPPNIEEICKNQIKENRETEGKKEC